MERLSRFPYKHLSLPQKVNLIFGLFFLVSATLNVVTFGLDAFVDPARIDVPIMFAVSFGLLFLARFDNIVIRVAQFLLLIFFSLVVISMNEDPSSLTGFILLTIAIFVAQKAELFGNKTFYVLASAVGLAILAASWGGYRHGFANSQILNLVNFVLAYFAILYVLFEEEIQALRRRSSALEQQTEELRPFAELGENTGGLVHDLKGDIQGVKVVASMERLEGNEEAAAKIDRFADRMEERVQSILYIATARDSEAPEWVDLKQLVESAVYYFVGVNRSLKHALRFSVSCPPDIRIYARRANLLVIIENVVKNSIEATEGQPRREIEITGTADEETVELVIANTGRPLPWGDGGPIDVLESHLFQRGKTTKPDGTGMGMHSVKAALRRLGGSMTIQNSDNGVRSTIRLPLLAEPSEQVSRQAPATAATEGRPSIEG